MFSLGCVYVHADALRLRHRFFRLHPRCLSAHVHQERQEGGIIDSKYAENNAFASACPPVLQAAEQPLRNLGLRVGRAEGDYPMESILCAGMLFCGLRTMQAVRPLQRRVCGKLDYLQLVRHRELVHYEPVWATPWMYSECDARVILVRLHVCVPIFALG